MEYPAFKWIKPSATTRRVTHRNFNTRLCNKSQFGHFSYEDRTLYAYDYGETNLNCKLRTGQRQMRMGDKIDRTSGNDPKPLCKVFSSGKHCRYGYQCRFMHVRTDQNSDEADDSSAKNIDSDFNGQNVSGSHRLDVTSEANMSYDSASRAKTVEFQRKICTYGKSIYFAHGQAASIVANSESREMTAPSLSSSRRKSTSIPGKEIDHSQEKRQGMNPVVKWNKRRINSIYADWIEDVPQLP